MDFINNCNFIGAGAALIGFLLGAILMHKWRKYREPFEQRWAWNSYHSEMKKREELKTDFHNLEFERNTLKSKVKELENIPEIAERLEALAKINAEIKERQEESNKLRKELGRLKNDKLIEEQKQAEEEAKAKKRAKREQAKEADDTISDLEEESENIGTKPPKNTR